MPIKINKPTIIKTAGDKPKRIEEYIGVVNSKTPDLSIARMVSPSGWIESGKKRKFTEYPVVLKGMLQVKTNSEVLNIHEGEAIIVNANEWAQYSTPDDNGAEYIAVCLPAFSTMALAAAEVTANGFSQRTDIFFAIAVSTISE